MEAAKKQRAAAKAKEADTANESVACRGESAFAARLLTYLLAPP